MDMKTGIAMFLLAMAIKAGAEDVPSITKIIGETGSFAFTDGSSVYTFKKDGTFKLLPVKNMARCVSGTWTNRVGSDETFVVQGLWAWVDGISKIDDYREMTLLVHLLDPKPLRRQIKSTASQVDLYDVYFTIEDIHPINVEKPKERNEPAEPRRGG